MSIEVKGRYDSIFAVIHASCNSYDLASISSILLDAEAQQRDMLFDNLVTVANIMVKNAEQTVKPLVDSGQSNVLDSG